MSKVKLLLTALYVLGLVVLIAIQALSGRGIGVSMASILYWYVFFGWVYSVRAFDLKSAVSLFSGLALFVVAVVVKVGGSQDLSQTLLRISTIGWLVGIFQALIEYIGSGNENRK